MRISRIFSAAAVMLLIFSVITLGGCTQPESKVIPKVPAPAVQTAQPTEKPVDQSAQKETPETNKTITIPKAELGPAPAEAKTPVKEEKKVFLTFDDGPNSYYTERVLDILAEKDVKATFMVVGKNVALNPGIVERILAEGHGLANHTYSHDYTSIYKSPEAFLADLEKNNNVLMPFTGKPVKIFRAPGGPQKLGNAFLNLMHSKGYISVGWNITSVDSDPNGVTMEQEFNNIVKDLERVERMKKSPIILMHDGTQLASNTAQPGTPLAAYIKNRESTIKALPVVIDYFKEKGYKFAVVDEHTPPAW